MSKAARILDVERTAIMLDLLRRGHEVDSASRAYVVLEEVAPGTGWYGGQRWADVLVLSVWPSNGLTLDGYEIKASRADLKRELSDLSKHEALARYCDTWTLIAWDSTVVEGFGNIPESWGITYTEDDDGQRRSLFEYRKPAKRTPGPWPRSFICSLVRNAYEQSPGAAYVARAVLEAHNKALWDYREARKQDVAAAVAPLARAIYGENSWKWPSEAHDPAAVVRIAIERLTQPLLSKEGA